MPPIIGLLLQYAPDLIGLFAGEKAGAAVGKVTDAAKVVFGTDDASATQAKIAADPKLAEAFAEQARQATEQLRLQIEDVQDARRQTVALAQQGSAIAWGPVVLSVVVTLGFVATVWLVMMRPIPMDERQAAIANILAGALTAAFVQVCNYWLGSSAGSKRSGDAVRAIAEATISPKAVRG